MLMIAGQPVLTVLTLGSSHFRGRRRNFNECPACCPLMYEMLIVIGVCPGQVEDFCQEVVALNASTNQGNCHTCRLLAVSLACAVWAMLAVKPNTLDIEMLEKPKIDWG